MFNAGTFDPEVDTGKQQYPFDHNLNGLEPYTSRTSRDSHHPHHDENTNNYQDEISVGRELMQQLHEIMNSAGFDGVDERKSKELFKRLTVERRRSASLDAGMVERRALSEDERAHAAPTAMVEDDIATPTQNIRNLKLAAKGKKRAHFRTGSESPATDATIPKRRPTITRSFTAPLPAPTVRKYRSSSDEARAALGVDMPRLLLYNYLLRRIENIQILSPDSPTSTGKDEDFELLRLLASTHQDTRWWTIMVDDLACPQCVEELRKRKTDARVQYLAMHPKKQWREETQKMLRPKFWGRLFVQTHKRTPCDGGRCRIICEHRHPEANSVTKFFSQLGPEADKGMQNIILETPAFTIPSADALVSCVQQLHHYFPNIQQLEICFHFPDLMKDNDFDKNIPEKVDRDTWTHILRCLVDLECLLPKNAHLRVKGLEGCDELVLGWGRRKRKWYCGRKDGEPLKGKPRCWMPRGDEV